MRLGVYLAHYDEQGNKLDAAGVTERARRIEAAGLDGIWMGDHLSVPSDPNPGAGGDSLTYLAVAAGATSQVEIGTCIYCLPLRNKYDVAQRLTALETLYPRRFTVGVGTGSHEEEYEANDLAWSERFDRLDDHMAALRTMFDLQAGSIEASAGATAWDSRTGRPRIVLGAWHSERQLKKAVAQYDGWMGSAGRGSCTFGWRQALGDAIKRYRDLGGQRAMVSTVILDLGAPTAEIPDVGNFTLQCPPEVAAERLHLLEELGYDDVLFAMGGGSQGTRRQYPYALDYLELVRSLMPRDPRSYLDT